jgi:hypothetical protein
LEVLVQEGFIIRAKHIAGFLVLLAVLTYISRGFGVAAWLVALLVILASVIFPIKKMGLVSRARSLGHVDKWRSQRRMEVMSMKPRKLWAVLS